MQDARYCPSCGAPPVDAKAKQCASCQGPLLPLGTPDPREASRCRGCGELAFGNARFCSSCGASVSPTVALVTETSCPACGDEARMERWILDGAGYRDSTSHVLQSCPRCAGLWVDRVTFEEIVREADRRAASSVPSRLEALPRREIDFNTAGVRYLKCPTCARFMNRKNFGRISGVIVDECPTHGSFLDAGELEAIRTFVKAGGLKVSAARDKAEQAAEARRKESRASAPVGDLRGTESMADRRVTWIEFLSWFFIDSVSGR